MNKLYRLPLLKYLKMSTPPQYPPLTALASIEDMEKRAVEILPKHAVGYWGGSAEEQTLARNRQAFKRYLIRQYILRDVSHLDTKVHLKLGTNHSSTENGKTSDFIPFDRTMPFPLGIAPSAFQRMAHSDGEKATVRAAGNTGTIMICSSFSNFSLEEIAANAPEGTVLWFQVSMCKDRRVTESLARRAIAAGVQALVVTPDPITEGRIRNNVRNGFVLPYHLRNLMVPNFEEFLPKHGEKDDARHNTFALIADSVTWETVEWLVSISPVPVLLKGVLRPEDAERAIRAGVAGVIVSNLGGRSLDHAPSTIEALAEISSIIGDRIPLFMDGGIRSGTDIFKALAMGAQTVFIGRPALYGLAVAGEDGVRHVIELLRREFENAMRLAGCSSIAEIRANRKMVVHENYYAKF